MRIVYTKKASQILINPNKIIPLIILFFSKHLYMGFVIYVFIMKLGNIMLSKSMVGVLIAVINGSYSLESLQKELTKSKSWVSRIIDSLDQQGFIKKEHKGKIVRIENATTPHAFAFRNMYLDKPHRKYPEIFSGKNLDVLQAIVTGEKSTKTIGDMMNVQARIIRLRLKFLASNGLIVKNGKRYAVSSKQEKVIAFLEGLRNFSKKNGIVLWKFGKTALLKTNKASDISGLLTGFNKYTDYGVEINTISFIYYTNMKKLFIEDVFIHSLFEINDQRTFAFAVVLYAKQKLFLKRRKERIIELAEKFDKVEEVHQIISVYDMIKNNKINESTLSSLTDVKEIKRLFDLYGVQNV